MAILDWLFGKDDAPTQTTTATTSTSMPQWYQDIVREIIQKGAGVAGEGYTPYPGARVAEFSPDTLAAFGATRQGLGAYAPYGQTSQQYLTEAGQPFDAAQFQQYLSPYTGDVMSRIADLGTRNLSEKFLPAVNATFTDAGQFGSSRHADFTGRALRDVGESVLGQQAATMENAYKQAMDAYQAGKGRQLQAGTGLAAAGSEAQRAGFADAAALEAIGQTQQQQGQRGLDVAYQDFLAQRDWPKTQVQFVSDIARGLPQPQTQTQTTTGPGQPGPSPISQLGGLGLGAFGIASLFNKKRGGPVRKRKAPRPGLAAFAGRSRYARAA